MANKKVLYFIAGPVATSPELTAIGKLNAAAVQQYEVTVMNAAANTKYGETDRLVPSDYVAGSVPGIYSGVTTIDPDAIPMPALPATSAVVSNAGNVTVKNSAGGVSKTGVATVAANAVTDVKLPATTAMVDDAVVIPVTGGGTVTLTVAGGLVTAAAYTAP